MKSWTIIRNWKEQGVAERVRSEDSRIDHDLAWNIELLEWFLDLTNRTKYIQYFMRSSRGDFISPVKTRLNQEAPFEDEQVILILDGAIQRGNSFIGKALFTLHNGEEYDFKNIDYANLVSYNDIATYEDSDAIACEMTTYHQVCHQGWCGYNSFGEALRIPRSADDMNSAGKIVFRRLVESGFNFNQTIDDKILNGNALPSNLWMTSDIRK